MLNVNELPTSLEELNLRNNSLTNFIMPTTVGSARLQQNQLDLRDNHLSAFNTNCSNKWLSTMLHLGNFNQFKFVLFKIFTIANAIKFKMHYQIKSDSIKILKIRHLTQFQFSTKLCDCKPECPRDCQCYHDRLFRKNLVYCTDATFNQSASTIPPQQRSVPAVEHRRFNVRSIPLHAAHMLTLLDVHVFLNCI